MGKSVILFMVGIPAAISTAATFVVSDYHLSQLFAALSIVLVLFTVHRLQKQMHTDDPDQQI